MTDSWRQMMQDANEKFLAKIAKDYPFRASFDSEAKPSLELVNRAGLPYAHCQLPISKIFVFAFKSKEDRERFVEIFGGTRE